MTFDVSRASVTIEEVAAAAGVALHGVARRQRLDGGQPGRARGRAARDRRAQLHPQPRGAVAGQPRDDGDRAGRARGHGRFFGDPFFASIVSGINRRLRHRLRAEPLHRQRRPARQDHRVPAARRRRQGDRRVAPHERHVHRLHRRGRAGRLRRSPDPRARARLLRRRRQRGRSGRLGTQHLVDGGHRRIGTITGPPTMPAGVDRLLGYREAIAAAGLPKGPVADGDFTADGGMLAMRRILPRRRGVRRVVHRERPHGARGARRGSGGPASACRTTSRSWASTTRPWPRASPRT